MCNIIFVVCIHYKMITASVVKVHHHTVTDDFSSDEKKLIFVTAVFFFFLSTARAFQDLSSLTRD